MRCRNMYMRCRNQSHVHEIGYVGNTGTAQHNYDEYNSPLYLSLWTTFSPSFSLWFRHSVNVMTAQGHNNNNTKSTDGLLFHKFFTKHIEFLTRIYQRNVMKKKYIPLIFNKKLNIFDFFVNYLLMPF